jgi:hypothetical protein
VEANYPYFSSQRKDGNEKPIIGPVQNESDEGQDTKALPI